MNLTSNYIERVNYTENSKLDLPFGCHIHFIGIGGSSMSGLAEIVMMRGYKVSGSDRSQSVNTERLRNLGATVYIGHDALNIEDDCYLVVYTLAISSDNPEYLKAISKGIPVIERGHFLGILTREHKYSIAVSGTHGKTTTTSMIASVMLSADLDPSIHIGGNLPQIGGNVRASQSMYFVTEACEYHENFLNLSPFAGVILNIEAEHLDYFKDISDICRAFKKFVDLIPKKGFVVACAENENVINVVKDASCKVITYGFDKNFNYSADDIKLNIDSTEFSVYADGEFYTKMKLMIPGKHNILNSLATIAVCRELGCSKDAIKDALYNFRSPERRFQIRGKCNGALVVDDYAHHPTEIKATLMSARQVTSGKVFCVFQPHTYSRAKAFGEDFANSLIGCNTLLVADIYAAREKNPGDISSEVLTDLFIKKGINAFYIPDFNDIAAYLKKEITENDTVVFLGAGNINDIVKLIVD